MKYIALSTALALAIPAAVGAQPRGHAPDQDTSQQTYDRDRSPYPDRERYPYPYRDRSPYPDRERYRDRYYQRYHYDRYDHSRWERDLPWIFLARRHSGDSDRQVIDLGGRRLRALRIEAVRGAPAILGLDIEFESGAVQAVALDARLPRGAGEVIDLAGRERRIQRIVVYTDPGSRGMYMVFGA